MKYEIEYNYITGSGHASIFCTLTGLSEEEVAPHWKNRMKGQDFISGFQKLGFNTNNRFVKFDPDTKYPIVLRCKEQNQKGSWYALVYHEGKVWNPYNNDFVKMKSIKGKHYIPVYGIKVTSMLQVWI